MTPGHTNNLPAHVRIVVIGAGFAGIGAAITLGQDGHDVLVLERADDVGGTWRDNAYPGCACDVPSNLYSFSFAPNPGWRHRFPPRPEIVDYLRHVVDRFGVSDRIRCGVEVVAALWDETTRRWRVRTTAGEVTAEVLVAATGPLSQPRLPQLPGLHDFTGTIVHSSHWDPTLDVTGRRVAVVGTGASAIQLVPHLAQRAAVLSVFQRTPAWILPRHDRAVPASVRRRYARHPAAQRLSRGLIYTSRELGVGGFVATPALMSAVERTARRHLRRQVPDPGLRALLTPDYRAGCKRILLSDDYYPALQRDDVELITGAASAVEPDAVRAVDGTRREVDTIVFATGFAATDPPIAHLVRGRDGRLLADAWSGGMRALRGTGVHGFPNLFFLLGPNTGLGHSSMVYVIESQLTYLREALRAMDARGLAAIEPTAQAQDSWNDRLQRRMRRTVWATGGCSSWYQDADGRISTLWPGSSARLRWETRRVDLLEYQVTPR